MFSTLRVPLWALLLVAIPPLVAALLLASQLNAHLSDLHPFWSDDLFYTQQARAFHAAGLNSGYFTVSEQPAHLAYSHYYVWGPFVAAWYSLGVKVFPLNPIWWTNALWLALTTVLAVVLVRPRWRNGLLAAVVLAMFPALHVLYPGSMQDGLHLGIAVLLSAAVARAARQPVSRTERALVVGGLLLAVLARPTWGLLTLPYLLLSAPRLTLRTVIGSTLLCIGLVAPLALLFQWSGAPYPHFRSQFFENTAGLGAILRAWWDYIVLSAGQLFTEGKTTAHLQRLELAVVTVVLLGLAATRQRPWRTSLFHVFNLVTVVLAVLALHEVVDGRDYRVVAPHLLLTLLALAWQGGWGWISAHGLAVVIWLPGLLAHYADDNMPRVRPHDPTYGVENALVWQPDADAWCNTITMSFPYVIDYRGNADMLLAFDRGLGLTWINPERVPPRFQAGYLLLTDEDRDQWADRLHITPLLKVNAGTLYRNDDAACP